MTSTPKTSEAQGASAPVLAPHVPLTAYYADEPARHRFVRRIFDDTASDYDRIEKVLALGTGQRNLVATFVVAGGNFAAQPEVLIFLTAAGLVGMVVLFPVAAEFGNRSQGAEAQVAVEAQAAK